MNIENQMPHELPTGVGLTSLTIARLRAAESRRPDRLIDDPFAQDFVAAAGSALAFIEQMELPGIPPEIFKVWRSDYIATRTRFFDDYLVGACASDCRQVVLLAAGLDARAFRLNWPQGVRLFELDVPAVLSFKEQVLTEHAAIPKCQRMLVPTDLRENWAEALRGVGFLSNEPTAWLIEGLLVYLEESDRDRLLDQVSRLSHGGSRLALDHSYPGAGKKPVAVSTSSNADDQAALARAAKLAGSVDNSIVDPTKWLAGHGWRARAVRGLDQVAGYGRGGLALTHSNIPDAWLVTAERS